MIHQPIVRYDITTAIDSPGSVYTSFFLKRKKTLYEHPKDAELTRFEKYVMKELGIKYRDGNARLHRGFYTCKAYLGFYKDFGTNGRHLYVVSDRLNNCFLVDEEAFVIKKGFGQSFRLNNIWQ